MKYKFNYGCVFLMALFCLSGCHSVQQNYQAIKNRPNAYMQSETSPTLCLPAGLEHEPLLADDEVPPGEAPKTQTQILPPDSLAQKVAEGKVLKKELKHVSSRNLIERNHQWILIVTEEKNAVWEKLDKVFKNRRIPVVQKNQTTEIYYFVDIYPTKNKITMESPIYQLHMSSTVDQNTELYLTNNQGQTDINPVVARRLLMEINRGLAGEKVIRMPAILEKILSEK